MKLYTRTGDEGKTGVIGGRVDKDDIRIEAYGTIDELNAFVALVVAKMDLSLLADIRADFLMIQHELFDCGGDLAIVKKEKEPPYKTKQEMIDQLEVKMDRYMEEAPPLQKFILPGGSELAALIHVCRTITRRAERQIASLQKQEDIHPLVFKYMNRLSDFFFVVARAVNARLAIQDVEYERSAIVFRESKKEN
ncbi:cob(I)yrinic acid a,c-diamide adenosyltransferase [Alkalihalobacillus sp. 1P02AB]|uniref:cob(I)yrinic acid a,c-diamide adenosyltransferase n=1 Tax=Alkalihalobacillus sp. 1P02AB TaxID=3132260 RepID=UPI0039A767B2